MYYHLGAFGDLAAARVLVPFISDVEGIADEIHANPHFEVLEDDNKTSAPDRLGYQARHLDVRVSDELIGVRPASAEGRQIRCEIQIHTFAQSLWANMSHLITYKRADLPEEIERRVFRLVALCELFDSEADLSQKLIAEDIDHAERIASELQRHFYALTGVEHEIDQSVSLVARLLDAIGDDERQQYSANLESFVDQFAVRLSLLLTDRPEARGIPWLLRPEALLIFERLTHAPQSLQATWDQTFPTTELDRLRDAWGPVD